MNKIVFLALAGLSLLWGNPVHAEAIEVDGYKISVTATQRDEEVSVSGRIDGGLRCNKLRLDIFLHDENSRRAHVIATANDVGGSGSRVFSGKDKVYRGSKRWSVSSLYTSPFKVVLLPLSLSKYSRG